jgi:hypothetical protein
MTMNLTWNEQLATLPAIAQKLMRMRVDYPVRVWLANGTSFYGTTFETGSPEILTLWVGAVSKRDPGDDFDHLTGGQKVSIDVRTVVAFAIDMH